MPLCFLHPNENLTDEIYKNVLKAYKQEEKLETFWPLDLGALRNKSEAKRTKILFFLPTETGWLVQASIQNVKRNKTKINDVFVWLY